MTNARANQPQGLLSDLERMPASRNGNPRYRAVIGGEIFVTGTDSDIGYSISNYREKGVRIEWRIIRDQRTIVRLESEA